MKHIDYKNQVITILKELVKNYPNQPLSIHLSIALEAYNGNLDAVNDKELFYLLEKYKCEKELDIESNYVDIDEFDNIEDEDEF